MDHDSDIVFKSFRQFPKQGGVIRKMIRSQNKLLDLLSQNKVCFDCTAKSPTCINMTIGSFVCMQCAGYLREFGHRIKSVTASTFSADEVSELSKKGNDYAAKTWLAVWIEADDPKPLRDNPKKIKEFMKKKYVLKDFYWDGSYSRAKDPVPVDDQIMVDWDALPSGTKSNSQNIQNSPQFKEESKINIPSILVKKENKSKVDDAWADFSTAFPTSHNSNNSSLDKKSESLVTLNQTTLPIPVNIKKDLKQDFQLDPFESVKSSSSRKYDAFKDLAGLSLSETADIAPLSSSPKNTTPKTLDLSKYVEAAGKSKYSWENTSDLLPVEDNKPVSSFSQFEMNPFAFDHGQLDKADPVEKVLQESDIPLKDDPSNLEQSLDLDANEWNSSHVDTHLAPTKDDPHHSFEQNSHWVGFDSNPVESIVKDDLKLDDAYNAEWDNESAAIISDNPKHSQISSFGKESSLSTLVESNEIKMNDPNNDSGVNEWKANYQPQNFVPYELDSNVWT